MSYLDLGYNSRLSRTSDSEINITDANVDAIVEAGAIGYQQSSLNVISGKQTLRSSNFVGGQTGWIIRGDGTAEFQSLASKAFVKVYSQDDAPTEDLNIGDIWYDTNDGNKRYVWNGTAWVIDTTEANWSEVIDDNGAKPEDNATLGADWAVDLTNIPESATASYITSTKITSTSIESPTITGGTLQTAVSGVRTVITGNDIDLYSNNTTDAFPVLGFNTDGTTNKGWGVFYTAYGGGGWTAGDLNILPDSGNDSDRVRFGLATQPCNVVIHGDLALGTLSGNLIPGNASQNIGGSSNYWGDVYCDGISMTGNLVTQENIQPIPAYTGSVGVASYPFSTMYATTYYFDRSGYSEKYIQMSADGTSIDCNHTFYASKLKLPVGSNLY